MAGETEHWTWRIAGSGMTAFVAPQAAPAILDPAGGGNPHNAHIAPPKGSTLLLKKMHGFYVATEPPGDTGALMKVVLAIIATAENPALGLVDLRTVWAGGLAHLITGTPVNAAHYPVTVPVEVEFDPEHRHSHIHNGGQRRFSEEFGFTFVHSAISADFSYLMDLTLDYDIIWDEESGRSRLVESEQSDWDQEGEI